MSAKPLLAYLVSHPIQYQAPLFRRLAASRRIDFQALFGCLHGATPRFDDQFGAVVDFGIDVTSGFDWRLVPQAGRRPSINKFLGLVMRPLDIPWGQRKPAVLVLHGWRTAMMWQAAVMARAGNVPYLMRAETPVFQHRPAAAFRAPIRSAAVRVLVKGAAAALSLGPANDRFYRSIGLREEQLVRVPYVVDNEAVAAAATEARGRRREIRTQLQIPPDSFLLVAVSKLIARKRPMDMVEMLKRVDPDIHLAWVGSGELFEALRCAVETCSLASRFHLLGFRSARETWAIMGAADALVLPSENEPWGLVANEAVAAGLPILISSECGAAESLVRPGVNGEILPVGDVEAWADSASKWHHRFRGGAAPDHDAMRALAEEHSIQTAALTLEAIVERAASKVRRA